MWLILSLLSALFGATKDAVGKFTLRNVDEYLVTWAFFAFSVPLAIVVLFFTKIPPLGYGFYVGILGSVFVNTIAFIAFFRSIKWLPLSFVVPLESFIPWLLALFSFFILKEVPTQNGIIGMALIVFGAYVLNLGEFSTDIFLPFKKLFRDRNNIFILVAIMGWTLSALFDKIAVQNSSPFFYLAIFPMAITIVLSFVIKAKSSSRADQIKKNFAPLISMAFLGFFMNTFYLLAINTVNISYVAAVRSLNFLFAVGYGYIIFKERKIKQKILGAGLMTVGAIMLAFV